MEEHSTPTLRALTLAACGLVALLCALPPTHVLAGEASTILLPPGTFHSDEVTVESGPGWLALYRGGDGGGPRLEPATVTLERVYDAILDRDGEATGKQVSVAGAESEPVLLLAGEHPLHPGPVTAASPTEGDLSVQRSLRLSLSGRVYELGFELIRPPQPGDPPGQEREGALVLRQGGIEQRLADYVLWIDPATGHPSQIGSDAFPQLLWAGDLDGDGRLDLYVDLTDHYNVSLPTLLLSSAAAPGELVAPVASHQSFGC